jgi:hypothetical protein
VALTPQTTIKVSMFSTRTASATHGDAGAAKLVAHSSPMNTQLGTDLPSKFFAHCYDSAAGWSTGQPHFPSVERLMFQRRSWNGSWPIS